MFGPVRLGLHVTLERVLIDKAWECLSRRAWSMKLAGWWKVDQKWNMQPLGTTSSFFFVVFFSETLIVHVSALFLDLVIQYMIDFDRFTMNRMNGVPQNSSLSSLFSSWVDQLSSGFLNHHPDLFRSRPYLHHNPAALFSSETAINSGSFSCNRSVKF